jgi:hypothetical protein
MNLITNRLFLFQLTMDMKVEWSLRDSNALLLMTTLLLLQRKDEVVIRQAAQIMKDLFSRLPEHQLKTLSTSHIKPLNMIFHKVSKVATYYTQLQIVDVLNMILKARDDRGAKIIQKSKIMASRSDETINYAAQYFDEIDWNNFLEVSSLIILQFSLFLSFLFFIRVAECFSIITTAKLFRIHSSALSWDH